jgi:hypothetical protein
MEMFRVRRHISALSRGEFPELRSLLLPNSGCVENESKVKV